MRCFGTCCSPCDHALGQPHIDILQRALVGQPNGRQAKQNIVWTLYRRVSVAQRLRSALPCFHDNAKSDKCKWSIEICTSVAIR